MIREVTMLNLKDIDKTNQPFRIIGKIVPVFSEGVWSFSECLYEKEFEFEKVYCDEDEQWEDYIGNPDKTIFIYYDKGDTINRSNFTTSCINIVMSSLLIAIPSIC